MNLGFGSHQLGRPTQCASLESFWSGKQKHFNLAESQSFPLTGNYRVKLFAGHRNLSLLHSHHVGTHKGVCVYMERKGTGQVRCVPRCHGTQWVPRGRSRSSTCPPTAFVGSGESKGSGQPFEQVKEQKATVIEASSVFARRLTHGARGWRM